MLLAVVVLVACVLAVAGAGLALSDARQALDRCDAMQREIAAATLDYRQKTAAARRKGWKTRRRRAAELEARQLVFKAVTDKTDTTEVRDGEPDGSV
jgi:hypothetical protein